MITTWFTVRMHAYAGRFALVMLALCFLADMSLASDPRKRIAIVAGKKSHGPEGNRIHDYNWSAKFLKVALDNSNVHDRVSVEIHLDGWPDDTTSLAKADAILIVSDGRDGPVGEEALHLATPERVAFISEQVKRGCGIGTFHFSTFGPDRLADQMFDWVGGYFDWETDGKREWYSAIQVANTEVAIASPDHPASRGVKPFQMNEEFYFNMRFSPVDRAIVPLLTVKALPGRDEQGRVVAWARERQVNGRDIGRLGARGFGTTCGHFYDNWKNDDFRKLVLNALVWMAHAEVPEGGVESRYHTRGEIDAALAGKSGTDRALVDAEPIRVLILTGNEAHKWHNWEKSTAAIKQAIEKDPRVRVDVVTDGEELAKRPLAAYQTLLINNYANWEDPKGLSEAGRAALLKYLNEGGGLVLVHFANGAFHYSLPKAGASDWPEYRKIVRRVWDHQGKGESQSGHDAFGPFTVHVAQPEHPLAKGLADFAIEDELYFRQAGEESIEPILTARSKVTNRDEPLAWTYTYAKARVVQTLLGHSEKTYDAFETREMLRRAVAFAGGRPIHPLEAVDDPSAAPPKIVVAGPPPEGSTAEGKFGRALDTRVAAVVVPGDPMLGTAPLTVDLWARLISKESYNILLAHQTKASPTHWELFTEPGTGVLCVYRPGMTPDHARSSVDLCDGNWHHVSLLLEEKKSTLIVDGKARAEVEMTPKGGGAIPGDFAIGRLVEGGLGCTGLVDDVRIRRGIFPTNEVLATAAKGDKETIGLWRFDEPGDAKEFRDESSSKRLGKLDLAAHAPAAKPDDHFTGKSVGFDWKEQDSADNRWNESDVGPFLASTIFLPDQPPVSKGLSIRVGDNQEAAVCYDTATGMLRAAWTGKFLAFDPTRFGLITPPRVGGELLFALPPAPNVEGYSYLSHTRNGNRVVLHYKVGDIDLKETPHFETRDKDAAPTLTRSFELGPSKQNLFLPIASKESKAQLVSRGLYASLPGERITLTLGGVGRFEINANGTLGVRVPATSDPLRFRVRYQFEKLGYAEYRATFSRLMDVQDLAPLLKPGKPLWPDEITTVNEMGTNEGAFQVDPLAIPFDNPYKALFFISDHDFLPNGDLAVSTVHGDVWLVRGVGESIKQLRWKRFATGLFQPLGLRVVDGVIHVLGRDQITRLIDENQDGEADRYECFHNGYETSPGGHDYVACLERDREGNFYLAHSTQGLLRISPDGKSRSVVATGLRNPNGMAIGPDGTITVSPQEGNWTPTSAIVQVEPGKFYGYHQPSAKPTPPYAYDPPLCWIPRLIDNSSGGQVWLTHERWGALAGSMLHLSYGQCRAMIVPREEVGGVWQGGVWQGGVAPLPIEFRSGVMRGRLHPRDGSLFVSGLKGWVSSAVDDGCLYRLTPTGKPFHMPIGFKTYQNGIAITFSDPLDRGSAENVDSYAVQAWNYKYGPDYGSADYRATDPAQAGREDIDIRSVTLLEDAKTVFLEVEDIHPAMQWQVEIDLQGSRVEPIKRSLALTIHKVGEERIDESKLHRGIRSGELPDEIVRRLLPGVPMQLALLKAGRDRSVIRMLGFDDPNGSFPEFSPAYPLTIQGYMKVPKTGRYEFRVEGGILDIDGKQVAWSAGKPVGAIDLRRGYHAIEASVRNSFRIYWSSDDFAEEPIPPTLLWHDSGISEGRGDQLSQGRTLVEDHRCALCHERTNLPHAEPGPSLVGVGSRLSEEWMRDWLLDPTRHRGQASMPGLFDTGKDEDVRSASAIASYLATLKEIPEENSRSTSEPEADAGLSLYENLGCMGCHRLTPVTEPDVHNRLSLASAGKKFQPGQLARYLQQPSKHFALTKMPDFHLSIDEANALSEHLESLSADPEMNGDQLAVDAKEGRKEFEARHCSACHSVTPDQPPKVTQDRIPLEADRFKWGCLAESDDVRGQAPRFSFDAAERTAISAYLGYVKTVPPLPRERDFASHWQSLRCNACHSRDGEASVWARVQEDESELGMPMESVPDLTWAGEKLRADWTESFLAGKIPTKLRPWLKARMPSFSAYAHDLAVGLAAEHGISRSKTDEPTVDPELAKVGEKLVYEQGGLGCRQCHAIGDQEVRTDAGSNVAPGINFREVKARMRHEHYVRFVLDPPRFDPATRMPKLALDGKHTKVTDVFEGDARRQYEAIWNFIQSQ